MVDYSIGVVAHVDRVDMAHELSAIVDAKLVNVDDGRLGCSGNHAFMQSRLASEPGWSVILEDDAVPINEFPDDLAWCLEHAPAPIVSLYLGTGYPAQAQPRILKALEADASWIMHNRLLHAVGYCIAEDIKGELARWMSRNERGPGTAPDEAVSMWAYARKIKVAYTNPSLCQHRDTPSVILVRRGANNFAHGRNRPRKAHNITARPGGWDDTRVDM